MSADDTRRLNPADLQQDHMGAWRNHPVTKLVFQYLADRDDAIKQMVLNGWVGGQIKLVDEQVYRGQLMAFTHVREISWQNIRDFYSLPAAPDAAGDQPTINTEPKEDDGIAINE